MCIFTTDKNQYDFAYDIPVFAADKVISNAYAYYYAYDIPVINNGTVVQIQSTRCNGIKECWNDIDELECGFNTSDTILIGMLLICEETD